MFCPICHNEIPTPHETESRYSLTSDIREQYEDIYEELIFRMFDSLEYWYKDMQIIALMAHGAPLFKGDKGNRDITNLYSKWHWRRRRRLEKQESEANNE